MPLPLHSLFFAQEIVKPGYELVYINDSKEIHQPVIDISKEIHQPVIDISKEIHQPVIDINKENKQRSINKNCVVKPRLQMLHS
jgi:hypothetical protein